MVLFVALSYKIVLTMGFVKTEAFGFVDEILKSASDHSNDESLIFTFLIIYKELISKEGSFEKLSLKANLLWISQEQDPRKTKQGH